MRTRWIASLTALSIIGGSAVSIAFAQDVPDFPDVLPSHIYYEPVRTLTQAGVIHGNPDGNFYPVRPVNRAEMLKMLYLAKGKIPDPTSQDCFPDVERNSWYEQYVCDAAANRYVQGYADGMFRPSDLVNRVEALKMIAEVFGITIDEVTDSEREIVKFVDVSIQAWYTKYLYAAFSRGILPIAGQEGARFYPNWPLLRGESAAYIFNALQVQIQEERQQIQEQQEQEDTSGEPQDQQTVADDTTEPETPGVQNVTFPFTSSGKFDNRKPFSFRFDITKSAIVSTIVGLQSGQSGQVSCRLYLLDDEGFSMEYFLGFQKDRKCYLLTALRPGPYQLQLQPTTPDVTFTVTASQSIGDGNDGFIQALNMQKEIAYTDVLTSNDLKDWFKFTVSDEKSMRVNLSNAKEFSCIIYAMEDVDLFGFTLPQCNQSYLYPPGTYYVAIGRKAQRAATQTYTVQLR